MTVDSKNVVSQVAKILMALLDTTEKDVFICVDIVILILLNVVVGNNRSSLLVKTFF